MTTTLPLDRPPVPTPPPPPGPGRGLVVGAARWSAHHKWTALLLWLAFVAAAIVGGGAIGTQEVADGDYGIGASAGADKAIAGADFDEPHTESVLVRAADGGTVDSSSDQLAELRADLAAATGVAEVSSPQPSADGAAVLYEVTLDVPEGTDAEMEDAASAAAAEVGRVVDDAGTAAPELLIGQVGDASLDAALDQLYEDDLRRAEYLSLPVSLLIMVVVFGALIAAAVPVLLALSSVVAAMGLSAFASHLIPSSDMLASVILLVGMAVGVDYSLFYVRREREERAKGRGTLDAVTVAAATSGRAVVVSGIAVIIAMAGMFFAGEATFESLAVGTILVVAVAVVGSVTALPALLSIFGRWIDRPRIPLLWRLRRGDGADSRLWSAILRPVLRHPRTALFVGVAALLALAAPALGMKLSQPGISDLAQDVPEVQTYDAVTAAFPAEGASHTVAVWSADGAALDTAAVDAAVAALGDDVTGDPRFAVDDELTAEYSADRSVAEIAVHVPYESDDERAEQSLEVLRNDLVPAAFDGVDGAETGVTGQTAGNVDFRGLLADRMPIVVGFVLLMTIVVLVMAFRSLTVALTAAALNLLSVAAAYGLLTLVFQNTWAESLLGFTSTGALIIWLPLFLFVILFGLSMDYHVFVVSRIREGARAGLTTPEAVRTGIVRSAGVVTSAAVVMVAVFSIFASLGAIEFKQLGIGLAAAILIDATIVRAVLLPSLMVLLGERNWWLPRPLKRLPALEH